MCNLNPEQVTMLEATIEGFIDERRMFTGYDVTRATRQREDVQMRHHEIAGSIHKLELLQEAVEFGDYKKRNVCSPHVGYATLYYPEEGDPTEYQLDSNVLLGNMNPKSPVSSVVSPLPPVTSPLPQIDQPVAATDSAYQPSTTSKLWDSHQTKDAPMTFDGDLKTLEDDDDKPKKGEYKLDYRNRLQVPFIRLMSLAAKSGSTVYLLPDLAKENITVSSSSMDEMSEIKGIVEKDGVCISSKVLRSAGFAGNLYQIQNSKRGDNKVIVISEKK